MLNELFNSMVKVGARKLAHERRVVEVVELYFFFSDCQSLDLLPNQEFKFSPHTAIFPSTPLTAQPERELGYQIKCIETKQSDIRNSDHNCNYQRSIKLLLLLRMNYLALLIIFSSVTTSTAQLNRVASRHLLRRRNRHSKGSSKAAKEPTLNTPVSPVAGSKNSSSKAAKDPTLTPPVSPVIGSKESESKPPHSYIVKTDRPTDTPSASPSKAGKEPFIGGDDVYEFNIIMESMSMEMVDSMSIDFL
eukprot:scaffold249334_cov83-Cyclotella_meneghiniana.AAC.6